MNSEEKPITSCIINKDEWLKNLPIRKVQKEEGGEYFSLWTIKNGDEVGDLLGECNKKIGKIYSEEQDDEKKDKLNEIGINIEEIYLKKCEIMKKEEEEKEEEEEEEKEEPESIVNVLSEIVSDVLKTMLILFSTKLLLNKYL